MNRSVPTRRPAHSNRRGFTLIELLVVILILGILMVIAMPVYNGAVADANHRTCRANMQTIANAEQSYYTRTIVNGVRTYTAVMANLAADLGSTPVCPQGGTYSITNTAANGGGALSAAATTFTVHCSYSSVAACLTAANNTANACPAPAHDAPYISSEPDGYTLNVNTQ